MLMSLPIVLACFGLQPCDANVSRAHSPAAVARPAEGPVRDARFLQTRASGFVIPAAFELSRTRGAQPPLRMARTPTTSKAMAVFVFAVAGLYAGAHVGAAADGNDGDSPGMRGMLIGAPVGAVLAGVFGWTLVR